MLIHLGACVVLHHPQKIVFLNACRALLHSVSQLAPPLHEWVLHLVFHFSSGLGQVWKPLQSASFAPFVEGSEHSAFRFSTQSRRRATPRGRPLCVRATSHMFSRLAEYRESLNSAWRAASALCNQEANGRTIFQLFSLKFSPILVKISRDFAKNSRKHLEFLKSQNF